MVKKTLNYFERAVEQFKSARVKNIEGLVKKDKLRFKKEYSCTDPLKSYFTTQYFKSFFHIFIIYL